MSFFDPNGVFLATAPSRADTGKDLGEYGSSGGSVGGSLLGSSGQPLPGNTTFGSYWARSNGVLFPSTIGNDVAIGQSSSSYGAKLSVLGNIYSSAGFILSDAISITKDDDNNLVFTDVISGSKTLAQLIAYGGGNVSVSGTPVNLQLAQWIDDHTIRGLNISSLILTESQITSLVTDLAAKASKVHNLVDTVNHPVAGLTPGHVLKALSPTTYGFAADSGVSLTPVDNILDWDAVNSWYAPHSSVGAGRLYSGVITPTDTTRLNYDGSLYTTYLYSTYNVVAYQDANNYNSLGYNRQDIAIAGEVVTTFNPGVVPGLSAIAYILDTASELSSTAKLLSVRNNGVEKLFVDKDGYIATPAGSLKHFTISAGNALGAAGTDAGNAIFKAGDSLSGDAGSTPGNVYLVPGNGLNLSNPGGIILGDANFTGRQVTFSTAGIETDIGIYFLPKGAGYIEIGTSSTPVCEIWGSSVLNLFGNQIGIGKYPYDGTSVYILSSGGNVSHLKGQNIRIIAGSGYGTGDNDGGNLYFYGGPKANGGTPGKIFIGTGSGGANPLAGSGTGTSILYYNRTTGEITYGDK